MEQAKDFLIQRHDAGSEPPKFEATGPRQKIFFNRSALAWYGDICTFLCDRIKQYFKKYIDPHYIIRSQPHNHGIQGSPVYP